MKRRITNASIVMAVVFTTVMLPGCYGTRWFWNDCGDIDLAGIEDAIDTLEARGSIRDDQAVARKKSMRESWDNYVKAQITCAELRRKASYHTDGLYPGK